MAEMAPWAPKRYQRFLETALPGRGERSHCRSELGCFRRFRLRARVARSLAFPLRLPHRSGLADFPHPARQVTVLLRSVAPSEQRLPAAEETLSAAG